MRPVERRQRAHTEVRQTGGALDAQPIVRERRRLIPIERERLLRGRDVRERRNRETETYPEEGRAHLRRGS